MTKPTTNALADTIDRIAGSVNDRMGSIQGRSMFDNSAAIAEVEELRELAAALRRKPRLAIYTEAALRMPTIPANDAGLVKRLRVSHGQIVHEFYSKDGKLYCDCAICDAADRIEALAAEKHRDEQRIAAYKAWHDEFGPYLHDVQLNGECGHNGPPEASCLGCAFLSITKRGATDA